MEQVVNAFLECLNGTEMFLRSRLRPRTDKLADFLRDFRVQRVNHLHRRMHLLGLGRFVVSLAGLTNVGKSTLVQALFKHPIAPHRNSPATAVPVEYGYAKNWRMTTHNTRDNVVIDAAFDSPDGLGAALTRKVFDLAAGEAAKIGKVLVRGPIDVLRGGLVFADTPGFGAANVAPNGANHNAALASYLSTHVHEVMFCVSGANCMIRKEEVDFFNTIRDQCTTVIVTKWEDGADMKAASDYSERFAEHFPYCGFRFVEAKLAAAGKTKESGIEGIVNLLEQRSSPVSRMKTLEEQIVRAWNDLCELSEEPARLAGITAIPWHKAALPRFLAAAKARSLTIDVPTR